MTNSVQLDNGFFAAKINTIKEKLWESCCQILSESSVICVLALIVLLNMSIIDPLSCGFVKSIALSLFESNHIKKECNEHQTQYIKRIHVQHYENSKFLFFEDGDFKVSYKSFSRNFSKIMKYFEKLNKQKSSLKKDFLEKFSL